MSLCLALLRKPEMGGGSHPDIRKRGPETSYLCLPAKLYLSNLQLSFLMCKTTKLGWIF